MQNLHYLNKIITFVWSSKPKIMAAPKNNTNASKWTEERVGEYLGRIETLARDRRELFLRRVLAKLGLYREVWTYWRRKFSGNEDLMDAMNLIKDRFESNLFIAGLKGEISESFTIMCLKANYGWREYHHEEIADVADGMDEKGISYDMYDRQMARAA
jgi:hypothetical protein